MTYLIAEPGIDVKDKNCTGECPAGWTCEGGPVHRRERQVLRPARLAGAAKTGPLPYDTGYVAGYAADR